MLLMLKQQWGKLNLLLWALSEMSPEFVIFWSTSFKTNEAKA